MASAPTVENLQNIVARYTNAYAPESKAIDTSIAQNEASGGAQTAGINAAKDTAFKNIDQNASNRGMYFSGFRPEEQATYLGSTYLPALAKLQDTIAATRNTLLGQKATLATNANTAALGELAAEKKAAADWQTQQEQNAFTASQQKQQNAFTASENAKNRAATAANAAASKTSAADQKKTDIGAAQGFLQSVTGSDNYVSPASYAQAKGLWSALGYNTKEFDQIFSGYRNPNNKYYKLG